MINRLAAPPVTPLAAVGTPTHGAHVVLYTAASESRAAVTTLSTLSEFAHAQGWTVVQELYDLAPLGAPRRHRIAWPATERILVQGEATGVVAPDEHEIAWKPAERTALRQWLLEVPAFAVFPQAGRSRGIPVRAEAPADMGAPVERQWSRSYILHPRSLRRVRTDAFTYLTALGWPGNTVAAVGVLSRLTTNAVVHASPAGTAAAQMDVLLAVAEDGELRIDVRDPSPEFPDSAAALNGEKGRGLRDVCLLGAEVFWSLTEDGCRKTVHARMAPGEVPL
ncbi:hypothetical protein ACWCQP_45925 [Streptomyces chartreusis]